MQAIAGVAPQKLPGRIKSRAQSWFIKMRKGNPLHRYDKAKKCVVPTMSGEFRGVPGSSLRLKIAD
jgi:hypothetical protein